MSGAPLRPLLLPDRIVARPARDYASPTAASAPSGAPAILEGCRGGRGCWFCSILALARNGMGCGR